MRVNLRKQSYNIRIIVDVHLKSAKTGWGTVAQTFNLSTQGQPGLQGQQELHSEALT